MQALVTGGAGFIGSHLCDLLLSQGHTVIAYDALITGRRANLAHLAEHPAFRFVEGDIVDRDRLAEAAAGCQWIFHLAGLADIVPSIEQPEAYFRSNVSGTLTVLQVAREIGCKRLVYAASSSCYGIPDTYPTPEDAPIQPEYPYALTKRLGEELCLHWGAVYGLEVLSLRLFNVYGPRSRTSGAYGAVFGVFLAQKIAQKPYTVVGDGNQTRDFTYVTDVADAFLCAAESDRHGRVYNVGSGDHYSINHLVSLLGGDVTHIPKRPGEPDCTFADIARIREELGWQPRVSFDTGVAEMLKLIDLWADAPVWEPASIRDATASWFAHLGSPEVQG